MTSTPPPPTTSSRKLVLLGESAVGKSSLVLQFVKGQFDDYRESTIGAAFLTQTVKAQQGFVKFEVSPSASLRSGPGPGPMLGRRGTGIERRDTSHGVRMQRTTAS